MAASAGTMVLRAKSGRTITIDVYVPDAVATELAFNATGLAASTSPTDYRVPEDCVIVDITTATAPTAVGGTFKVNSGVVNGGTFRWADRINTLSKRADLAIPVRAGDFISVLQH
jgi:hypothetical protein